MGEPSFENVIAVYQLYGRQSHAIDSGNATGWAETFTEDGAFHSPSYPQSVERRKELIAFAEQFYANCQKTSEQLRHVITDISVRMSSPTTLSSRAYLQIVGTTPGKRPVVQRLTVINDDIQMTENGWRISNRYVTLT